MMPFTYMKKNGGKGAFFEKGKNKYSALEMLNFKCLLEKHIKFEHQLLFISPSPCR